MARAIRRPKPCTNCQVQNTECNYRWGGNRCRQCANQNLNDCDSKAKNPSTNTRVKTGTPASTDQTRPKQPLSRPSPALQPPTDKWHSIIKGEYFLAIGADFGTKNCSACWQIYPKDQKLTGAFHLEPRHVLYSGKFNIPAQAAIVILENGPRLIFSDDDMEDHYGSGFQSEDIFIHLKLMQVSAKMQSNMEQRRLIEEVKDRNLSIFNRYKAAGQLPPNVEKVSDILREYLRWFWGLINKSITAGAPSSAEIDLILREHTKVIVAVPAIWTSAMNHRFRQLLLDAGFPSAHIRSEPKLITAALAQKKQREHGPFNSEADAEQYMADLGRRAQIVVDIGGGTTDLNSIQILQLWPQLKFKTLVVGTGSMSGSELLNHLFKQALKDILGENLYMIANHVGMTGTEILASFVHGFERAKRTFGTDKTGPVKVHLVGRIKTNLPRLARLPNLGPDYIRVSPIEMRAVFDEYVAEIMRLIGIQLDKLDKAGIPGVNYRTVMLVGGGSMIPYINEKLRAECENKMLQVTYDEDNVSSLVARGGILAAIDPDLGRREFARTTYGTTFSVPFDSDNPIHWADRQLRRRAVGYVEWDYELHERFFGLVKYGANLVDPKEPPMLNDYVDIAKGDIIEWPLEIEQPIYQVDDHEWGLKDDWSILALPGKALKVATLVIKIKKQDCKLSHHPPGHPEVYRVHFRAKPVWDGLCEKWLFFVHLTGKRIATIEDEQDPETLKATFVLDEALAMQYLE